MQHTKVIFSCLAALCLWILMPEQGLSQDFNWEPVGTPAYVEFSRVVHDHHEGRFWAISNNQLYFSDDESASWKVAGLGNVPTDASFFFGPSGIVSINNNISADGGATWKAINLPDTLEIHHILVLDVNQVLLASTSGGLFKSEDYGSSWTLLNEGAFVKTWMVSDGTLVGSQLMGQAFGPKVKKLATSSDGGDTWQEIELPNFNVVDFIEDTDGEYHLLFKSSRGVQYLRSTDKGDSWLAAVGYTSLKTFVGINDGGDVYSSDGTKIFIHPAGLTEYHVVYEPQYSSQNNNINRVFTEDQILYRISRILGHQKSTDFGQTWENISVTGIFPVSISELSYLGGRLWATTRSDGIYSSQDGGESWQSHGLQGQNIGAFIMGTNLVSQWAVTPHFVYSTAGINSAWLSNRSLGRSVIEFRYNPYNEFIFAISPEEIFYTNNKEVHTWHSLNVPHVTNPYDPIVSMAAGPGDIIYVRIPEVEDVKDSNGIYATRDYGGTWNKLETDFLREPQIGFMMVDSKGNLWVGEDHLFYKSPDEGVTWIEIENDDIGFITDMLETPDGSIWVAHDDGLERTMDGGATWLPDYDYFDDSGVFSLLWNAEQSELIVETYPRSIHKAYVDLKPPREPPPLPEERPFQITAAYPNPATNLHTLQFSHETDFELTITLYDAIGRKVQDRLTRSFTGGTHQMEIDVSGLASGQYFIRFQTDSNLYSAALIKK